KLLASQPAQQGTSQPAQQVNYDGPPPMYGESTNLTPLNLPPPTMTVEEKQAPKYTY
uniref:Uncharacterized protein n=1 Tax=Acrobeloides nanus TaxID=290746 RepID=A0A914CV86_9BILA